MQKGGCQCGSVSYELVGDPMITYACHCTDCQTGSGSAFSITTLIDASQTTIIKGEIREDEFHLNGNDLTRVRCSQCGTGLWYYGKAMPQILALKPGTLDDTSQVSPAAHVWTRSAQTWVTFQKGVPQFAEQPSIEELMALR